jgi:hypothetical protein
MSRAAKGRCCTSIAVSSFYINATMWSTRASLCADRATCRWALGTARTCALWRRWRRSSMPRWPGAGGGRQARGCGPRQRQNGASVAKAGCGYCCRKSAGAKGPCTVLITELACPAVPAGSGPAGGGQAVRRRPRAHPLLGKTVRIVSGPHKGWFRAPPPTPQTPVPLPAN